jgi:wyosine [tRNA(Phe)-imidazoG37] synthetase (radical SAM superfamily)
MKLSESLETAKKNHPRSYQGNKYVYPVISRRAGGVSIGIDLNPEKNCNFNCCYCQIDRTKKIPKTRILFQSVLEELETMLNGFNKQGVCELEIFKKIPDNEKVLHDLAISGSGEPTLYPKFNELCEALAHMQQSSDINFKLIVITNGTLLHKEKILSGLGHLLKYNGEIWAKLDAGSEEWHKKANDSKISLNRIEKNIIIAGKEFPLTIQTLFFKYNGIQPSSHEIEAYSERLLRIRDAGVTIPEIQLYTIARTPAKQICKPISNNFLVKTGKKVQEATGIKVNIY